MLVKYINITKLFQQQI